MTEFIVENGKIYLTGLAGLYEDFLEESYLHNEEEEHEHLCEANYKEIAAKIDNNFLKQKIRAKALDDVRFAGIEDQSLMFWVNSSQFKDNSLTYTNVFKIKEWSRYIDETTMNPIERSRQLLYRGNLMLHCTCPSFLFHGYKFLLHQMQASLEPETRPPIKRNPQNRGIVCKHLHRSIKVFPFYTAKFASYIKKEHKVDPTKSKAMDMKSRLAQMVRRDPDADATYESVI